MSSGDKLLRFLFVWESLYLSLISEGRLCQVKYSWSAVLFFFSALCIYYSAFLWPGRFLLRDLLIALQKFACMREFFSLAMFKILFTLYFRQFHYNVSCWKLFWIKIWGDPLASWTWMSQFQYKFRKFSDVLSFNKLSSLLFPFFYFWHTSNLKIVSLNRIP